MTAVSDKTKALEAAQHLAEALAALNAADGVLAVQAPTTPYSRVSKAFFAVLEAVASQEGASAYWAERWAGAVYAATVLGGETVEQALETLGTAEQFAEANTVDEHALNEAWGV